MRYLDSAETHFVSDSFAPIAVLLPYRQSPDRADALDRVANAIKRIPDKGNIVPYVVDYGSPTYHKRELRDLCLESGANYIYVDTRNEPFAIGKARDIGAVFARSDYLFVQDIDLLTYRDFYRELLADAQATRLVSDPSTFLTFPVFYLDPTESAAFLATPDDEIRSVYLDKYYAGAPGIRGAIGSSSILVNRRHYLGIGGHDPAFVGHGFEDFEMISRLANVDNRFVRPRDYYTDRRTWDAIEYTGIRAYLRNYAEASLRRGRFLVHIFHESTPSSSYAGANARNKELLQQKLREFDAKGLHPRALPDAYKGRTLALGEPHSAFYRSINYALPDFGQIEFVSENEFATPDDAVSYIRKRKFDRVLMPNPYGNETRLRTYRSIREHGIPFVVSDRGALIDSVFFDAGGFNADSSSYSEQLWNAPLTDSESERVREYMRAQAVSSDALEHQGERVGAAALAERLGIRPHQKVLFVPLQRPSDTVCRYFAGEMGGMPGFVDLVYEVSRLLGDEWRCVIKKHPLETETPNRISPRWIEAPEDAHINDLLSLSDAVLTLNSGVGVSALIAQRPVLVAGQAFYSHPRLTTAVASPDDVLRALQALDPPDEEVVERFIYHLLERVYSFGKSRTELSKKADGSLFRVTRYIEFYRLSLPGLPRLERVIREEPIFRRAAPHFDRYRHYFKSLEDSRPYKATEVSPANRPSQAPRLATDGFTLPSLPARPDEAVFRKTRKLLRDPRQFIADFIAKRRA